MRDLYRRLGISKDASFDSVRLAIEGCEHARVKRDAAAVLLQPTRRRAYDAAHATLSEIGALRGEFGLSHTSNWSGTLASDFPSTASHHQRISARGSALKPWMSDFGRVVASLGVVALLLIFMDSEDGQSLPSDRVSTVRTPVEARAPTYSERPVLLVNGTVRKYTSQQSVAPLEIRTQGPESYYVKLEDASSGMHVLDVLVRGGSTVEIDVPLGDYIVKYASGKTWYGYEHYFGPDTLYNKADSVFRFQRQGSQIRGYTITLYRVVDGNLRTRRISATSF